MINDATANHAIALGCLTELQTIYLNITRTSTLSRVGINRRLQHYNKHDADRRMLLRRVGIGTRRITRRYFIREDGTKQYTPDTDRKSLLFRVGINGANTALKYTQRGWKKTIITRRYWVLALDYTRRGTKQKHCNYAVVLTDGYGPQLIGRANDLSLNIFCK
jgi:hypothetical protein